MIIYKVYSNLLLLLLPWEILIIL